MKSPFFSKERILLAGIALLGLLEGAYLFRDELFPNPGIYFQYIGAQDYPVAPVVIALRPLSGDKIKAEFNWEFPPLVPQYTVTKNDLTAMIKRILRTLPKVDSEPSEAQFVVTVVMDGKTKKVETDRFHSMALLNSLLQSAKPKYVQLCLELTNLEAYSRYDKRHPFVLPTPTASQVKKPRKNPKKVKTKGNTGP